VVIKEESKEGEDHEDDLFVIYGFGKPNSRQRKYKNLKVFFSRVPKTIEFVEVTKVDKHVTLKLAHMRKINEYIKKELNLWK
jgi:hypothetical protein